VKRGRNAVCVKFGVEAREGVCEQCSARNTMHADQHATDSECQMFDYRTEVCAMVTMRKARLPSCTWKRAWPKQNSRGSFSNYFRYFRFLPSVFLMFFRKVNMTDRPSYRSVALVPAIALRQTNADEEVAAST
jgi:hypothetical protein